MLRPNVRRLFRLAVLRRDLRARDVDDEIALHIDLRAEQLIRQGLPPREARAEAERRFASMTSTHAAVHRAASRTETIMQIREWFDSLRQDLRFATRALARRPGFTFVGVATLALGVGMTTAGFSVVYAALLRPLPYGSAERLVQLWETSERTPGDRNPVSVPNYRDWLAESRSFDAMLAYAYNRFTVTGEGLPEQIQGAQIWGDLVGTLGVQPLAGRSIRPEDARAEVVVLGESIWRRRFGADPGVVGRTMRLGGKPHTIVGVMPASFTFPRPDVEVWTAYASILSDPAWSEQRGRRFQRVIARLRPEVGPKQAAAEIDVIARGLATRFPEANAGGSATLVPLREQLVGEARRPLLLLLGAVGCVLLIACANVTHLLLARTAGREREIAVRVALGASKSRIARALMTESLVLAVAGGVAGVTLAYMLVSTLGPVEAQWLESAGPVSVDRWVLLFSTVVVALSGILAGLAPALRAVGGEVSPTVQGGSRTAGAGPRRHAIQGLLVSVQVATALLLLVGAGLLVRSYDRLSSVDPGIEASGVLTALIIVSPAKYSQPEMQRQTFDRILERVAALPGVRSVGLCDCMPPDVVRQGGSVTIEGGSEEAAMPVVEQTRVHAGYFSALRIPIVAGRAFTAADRAGAPDVAMVNATFARRLLGATESLSAAVGRRISLDGENWMTVVGVAGDVRYAGLAAPVAPAMYYAFAQHPFPGMNLFVRTDGDPLVQVPAVQRAVLEVDPDLPLARVGSLEKGLAASVADQRLNTSLLGGFATLAAMLAALGIYGVVAHAVARREREMGVRMALGARPADVVRLNVRRGMQPVLVGIVLGIGLATAATRLLGSALYGTSPLDPLTYATAATVFALAAGIAAWIPSRRAGRADPAAVLRAD